MRFLPKWEVTWPQYQALLFLVVDLSMGLALRHIQGSHGGARKIQTLKMKTVDMQPRYGEVIVLMNSAQDEGRSLQFERQTKENDYQSNIQTVMTLFQRYKELTSIPFRVTPLSPPPHPSSLKLSRMVSSKDHALTSTASSLSS